MEGLTEVALPMAPAVASLVGAAATSKTVAQVAPGPTTDVLNYGAVGVLAVAFLYFVYALSQNRIVSRDAAQLEKQMMDTIERLTELMKDSAAREDRITAIAERQMNWLEGRGGRSV